MDSATLYQKISWSGMHRTVL